MPVGRNNRWWWLVVCLVFLGIGTGAHASPAFNTENAYGGWRLLQYDPLRAPDPFELRAGYENDDLREQLLGLIPGETLETVARTLTDRTVQLRFSSDKAVVLVRIPIG